jgi:general secretion pathway protein I
MWWRSAHPDAENDAGFTLVEALAALAVMAAGLAAIGALAASSLSATAHTERHVAEIDATRAIIAGMPKRNALAYGRSTGTLLAHRWRIDASPVPTSLAGGAPTSWRPQGITLLVTSPSGGTIEVDTIRLRKDASK